MIKENKYTSKFLVFKNPLDMLIFYDKNFLDEIYRLYPWQVEILREFSKNRPIDDCIRMAVVAANGSGKSQFVLAPCVIWLNIAFENALSYVTSSSAAQLDTQTERFIDSFADKMDLVSLDTIGIKVWDNIKRHKRFLPNKSFIDLFATDEPKRAEGKHPLVPDAEFGIFVDEGKSISEDIYGAITRCRGATRRLDVSSTGGCHGHFYEVNTRPELNWWTRKITYKDCPHISEKEFEHDVKKYGIHDPLLRSSYFSEFSDISEKVVIRRDTIETCYDNKKIPQFFFTPRRGGIDLSGGGDEMVLSIWEGNIMIGQETARIKNVVQAVYELINWINKWNIEHENVYIEVDGFNKGIVAMLDDKGYCFNKILSGGKAQDDKRFANRITELWFKFKRYVEEGLVYLIPDLQLKSQLCNRYYRYQTGNERIILESKDEARKKGHPSPDRADALVFAWASCPNIEQFNDEFLTVKKSVENKYGRRIPAKELDKVVDEWTYGETEFFDPRNSIQVNGVGSNLALVDNSKYVRREEGVLSTYSSISSEHYNDI